MHIKLASIHNNQSGDTIVEVLIATALISLVLGSSYALVSRTVRNSQQTQEHTKALRVAEGQLERLKAWNNMSSSNDASTLAGAFCIDSTPAPALLTSVSLGAASLPTAVGSYPTVCRVADGSATDRYLTGITYDSTTHIYKVYVNWNGPSNTNQLVNLSYRVYP